MILSISLLCPQMAHKGRTTPFMGFGVLLPLLAVKDALRGHFGAAGALFVTFFWRENKTALRLEKARRVRYNKIVKNRELTSLIINAPLWS